MISNSVDQRVRAVVRELQLHRTGVVVSMVFISLIMLTVGLVMPKNYKSSALLYAHLTSSVNILLGPESIPETDHAGVAKEIISTRRFMDLVVQKAGVLDENLSKVVYERELAKIRGKLMVRSKGKNYIEIVYTDKTPESSFQIVDAAVSVFIDESAVAKQNESRRAFDFIQGQVTEYKEQLDGADNRLKDFRSSSRDGTEATATARISDLRTKIEQLKLDIEEAQIKSRTVGRQLRAEGKWQKKRKESEELRARQSAAQAKLDELLLAFTDTHPDVLAVRDTIADLEKGILAKDVQGLSGLSEAPSNKRAVNPLYEELRKEQSKVRVKIETSEKRLRANEALLEQEYERMDRIVGRGAEYSELTRGYDTMSNIYEQLLNTLEEARMVMVLGEQNGGHAYKIEEPPIFPLLPSGLRFMHFLVLGPFLALLVPIALIYLYVELDPRVRMANIIQEQLRVPVLAVVPHITTPIRQTFMRSDLLPHYIALLFVVVVYVAASVYQLTIAS
ncbi:MAG: XrtA system polysaccharide chain length determinant [Pseudomonadales bacterium]